MKRWAGPLAVAIGFCGAAFAPAAAQASKASVSGGVVTYTAAAGETNIVTVNSISFSGEAVPPGVVIEDAGANITPGAGCEAILEGVVCGATGTEKVIAYVLDGNDTVADLRPVDDGVAFYGGSGADLLTAGPNEGGLQRLDGGPGNDRILSGFVATNITGGDGNDAISVNDARETTVDAGAGNDTVFYSSFSDAFPPSLRLGAGNDTITLGFDASSNRTVATPYGERSTYTYAPSTIQGGTGYDTLKAETQFGFAFDLSSCACGLGSIDRSGAQVEAPDGDVLIGTNDGNRLLGSSGDDIIIPKSGGDTVRGGAGADRIVSSGDVRDDVGCGQGKDTVDADLIDNVWGDCEKRAKLVL